MNKFELRFLEEGLFSRLVWVFLEFVMAKSKRSSKSSKRSGKSRKHSAAVKRAKVHVVPGYTRVGGAYGRSLPCGPEKKFLDTVQAPTNMLGTGGTFVATFGPTQSGLHFCLVPQNTTEVTRIGNKICVKNFNFKGMIYLDPDVGAGTTSGGAVVRYIFFIDKQANGAQATAANLLSSISARLTDSFRELDEVERFIIIKDKTIAISPKMWNPTATAAFGQVIVPFKCSWKGDLPVHFSSTTGALTELRSENISLLIFSDDVDTRCTWRGIGRIKFTDM